MQSQSPCRAGPQWPRLLPAQSPQRGVASESRLPIQQASLSRTRSERWRWHLEAGRRMARLHRFRTYRSHPDQHSKTEACVLSFLPGAACETALATIQEASQGAQGALGYCSRTRSLFLQTSSFSRYGATVGWRGRKDGERNAHRSGS
jgi:hypothetical protein